MITRLRDRSRGSSLWMCFFAYQTQSLLCPGPSGSLKVCVFLQGMESVQIQDRKGKILVVLAPLSSPSASLSPLSISIFIPSPFPPPFPSLSPSPSSTQTYPFSTPTSISISTSIFISTSIPSSAIAPSPARLHPHLYLYPPSIHLYPIPIPTSISISISIFYPLSPIPNFYKMHLSSFQNLLRISYTVFPIRAG